MNMNEQRGILLLYKFSEISNLLWNFTCFILNQVIVSCFSCYPGYEHQPVPEESGTGAFAGYF